MIIKKKPTIAKALVGLSGGQDSNLRPLAPHASALPGCATTRSNGKGAKCNTKIAIFKIKKTVTSTLNEATH